LSIGVAAARTDATSGNDLIRIADTALYTSKQLGRNRVSVASDIDAEKTYRKTALHRLDDAEIAGRSRELTAVSEALGSLSLGKSRFVVIDGAAGMGKSTLVDTVRASLKSNDALHVVRVSGRPQEGYRPYYVVGSALVSLLNLRADKGVSVVDTLSEKELRYLGYVLPHLHDVNVGVDDSDASIREGIFVTLVQLLGKLLSGKPLVLLIDDIHFADEASLALLRTLFMRRELSLLVCATAAGAVSLGQEETPPWNRFLEARAGEIGIETHQLGPLRADDIAQHLSGVFPGIDLPGGFEQELSEITQGNPLFLAELIRKLVLEQKLKLVGQRWTVESPEQGYLPRSLEEIVADKIAALDEEGRKLLEEVSALGEDVPLSVVTGASEVSESRVLEFLDRAEDLGLLRADFQINDETMRFLSKRVLEIVYGNINQDRRQELHGKVGTYQEELFQKNLGPSASILAYHFKLSADQDKARRYDQIRIDLSQRTFNRDEAENYSGELLQDDDEGPQEEKLPPESLNLLPNLFRTFLTTVRSSQLYPPDSQPILKAHEASLRSVEAVLAYCDRVNLSRAQGVLLANSHKVDTSDFRLLASSYLDLLSRAELEGIEFRRGLDAQELQTLLTHLGQLKPEGIDSDYWKRFGSEHRLEHVTLKQMRYAEVRKRSARAAMSPLEADLDADELAEIPKLLRALLGAAKNIKLYPLGSKPVSSSIAQLYEALEDLLSRQPAATLACANDALLINGNRLVTTGYDALAENVIVFLEASELTSLTFLEKLTREDLEAFVGALKDLPSNLEPSFWQALAKEKQINGIAFNDRRYAVSVRNVLASVDEEFDGGPADFDTADLVDESTEALIDSLPSLGKDLLVRGQHELVRKILKKLFKGFSDQEPPVRERIVRSCRDLMEALIQALQHQFSSLSTDFLLLALRDEDDDQVLADLANLLHQMTGRLLQFADFALASRIFSELRDRQHALLHAPSVTGRGFAVLNRKMDAATQSLLMEELQSKEPARQEKAAQVLESMGKPAIPLLIEVIKQEKDFRTRQLAAGLVAQMGPEAAERLKREVVLEVTSEQRFRILEVVDVVTRDLRTELAFCLSDVNPKVRRAAFRLTERLNDMQVLELLVDFARHEDIGVAKGAIRSLANLHSPHAVGALVSTLDVTHEPERAIACAQALAQLGDPVAIPALETVLTARKFPILGGKRWDDQVRATAAFALAQIGGERAKRALKAVADDPDPRIRQIAASAPRRSSSPILEEPDDAMESDDEGEGVA
jgi:HEAT repeat protein